MRYCVDLPHPVKLTSTRDVLTIPHTSIAHAEDQIQLKSVLVKTEIKANQI